MDLIQEQLKTIEAYIIKQQLLSKEALTFEEAAIYLDLSKSALYKMTSKREIPHYVPGGKKIYFRRSELNDWVFNLRITPLSELHINTENFLSQKYKAVKS